MTFFSVNFYNFLLLYSIIFCRIGKIFTIVSSNRFSIFAIYLMFILVIGSFSFLCVGVGGIQGGYYIWRTKINIKIRYLLSLSTLLLLLLIIVVVVAVVEVVVVFGTEFRASYMWGKHSTTKLHAQSFTSFWGAGFPLNMELPTSSHWINWPLSPRIPLCLSPVLSFYMGAGNPMSGPHNAQQLLFLSCHLCRGFSYFTSWSYPGVLGCCGHVHLLFPLLMF